MGLEVGGKGYTKEKKKEEEKIPHMYESIGQRPLRGRCPKRSWARSRRISFPLSFSNLKPKKRAEIGKSSTFLKLQRKESLSCNRRFLLYAPILVATLKPDVPHPTVCLFLFSV